MQKTTNGIPVTGMGVVSSIGSGLREFSQALQDGLSHFETIVFDNKSQALSFPVAPANDFDFKQLVDRYSLNENQAKKLRQTRNLSRSAKFGVCATMEAWKESQLEEKVDKERVAIVSSGSNIQQQTLFDINKRYQEKIGLLNPNYAMNFWDTDLIGIISETLEIRGEGFSVGAASASGNSALIQGARLIQGGEYDAVIVVAPMMEMSVYEYQGFSSLGAMASLEHGAKADEIYCPFDASHNGFVYGECAGAMILENASHAKQRSAKPYAVLESYGLHLDANRNPNPSAEGEAKAMEMALRRGKLEASSVDYVNTHGSGSVIGDISEVEAMLAIGLEGIKANSTKSLIGHGLTSAGLVESIALIAQMNAGFLHPTRLLNTPISNEIDWVMGQSCQANIHFALNNSFGFGGSNTSVLFSNPDAD